MTKLFLSILILFAPQAPNLDGRWQAVSAEIAGKAFPDEVTKSLLLVLKDGTYTLQNDRGMVRLLEDNKMEITGNSGPNNGKTYKAIYDFQGDALTICYDLSGESFPSSFQTTPNTKLFLVKYNLVK